MYNWATLNAFSVDGCTYRMTNRVNGDMALCVSQDQVLARPHIPTSIDALELNNFSSPHLPDCIGHLTYLTELIVWKCTDIGDLRQLTNLVRLEIRDCGGVDIGQIGELISLEYLTFHSCSQSAPVSIKPLGGLKNLTHLDLIGWGVADLSPLIGMKGLRKLNLSYPEKWDFSPLDELPDLVPPDMPDLVPLDSYSCFEEYAALLPLNSIEPLRKLKNLAPLGLSWRGHVYT